jgi:DNA damage-binding protein 2
MLCRSGPAQSLLTLEHPRVVSRATFSPHTGRRIVTTCSDNRLRVWDDVSLARVAPDREIVHSHDFNRYLTNFAAVFDPKVKPVRHE